MLTQELFDEEADEIGREEGGEEGRAGEAAGGDEEEDDDDEDEEEGYESPEYPFPPKARQRQMEEELNKDYDMNQE
jgi:hypothetical protein